MPDISMCQNTDCPSKEECYRYVAARNPHRQSYIEFDFNEQNCFLPVQGRAVDADIIIAARYEVKAILQSVPDPKEWVVVSIREAADKDNDTYLADIREWEDMPGMVVPLYFDDVSGDFPSCATEEDVITAVKYCQDKRKIVVHCHAGISRSSAIAYLIKYYKHGDAAHACSILDLNRHSPNAHVVDIGVKIFRDKEIKTKLQQWREGENL